MPTYTTDISDGSNGFRFDGEGSISSPGTVAALAIEPVRVAAVSVPTQTMVDGQPA